MLRNSGACGLYLHGFPPPAIQWGARGVKTSCRGVHGSRKKAAPGVPQASVVNFESPFFPHVSHGYAMMCPIRTRQVPVSRGCDVSLPPPSSGVFSSSETINLPSSTTSRPWRALAVHASTLDPFQYGISTVELVASMEAQAHPVRRSRDARSPHRAGG